MAEVSREGVLVGSLGIVLWISREVKQKGENWLNLGKGLLIGIVGAAARASKVVEKHLPFCRGLSMHCIED